MSLKVDKNCMKMKIRDVENAFRYRRIPYPKRSVELIALIAISCTFFLFMHTKNLNTRLREMEVKLQPSEFSALGLTGEHHISGGGDGSRSGNDINTLHGTYQYLKSTGQIETLSSERFNNTPKAEIDILFFNRVPKVGSQSLMQLMKRLSKINGYISVRDKPQEMETILVTSGRAYQIADEIMELREPAAYSKHIAYLNFTQLDFPRPIYINLVRDPIERLTSWFYYIRAPWYIADRKKHFPNNIQPSAEWLDKDFATCLRNSDPECVFEQNSIRNLGDHRRQMLFFCGQDDSVCLPFNSYHALQIAKRTVEKDYAVVGSWEDTNITLTVLEKYIPRFFTKALDVYQKSQNSLGRINKNTSRPPVTQEIRDLLSRNMTNEIEFYQFCKQRLYKQYIAESLTPQNILKKSQTLNDDNLNNTKKAEIDILIFNRVPKVGSQSLMMLMNQLGMINNYITARDLAKAHETVLMDKVAAQKFAEDIISFNSMPLAYSQHMAYVNFTKMNLPRPIYINMVRDPIERIISWHYYIRTPSYYERIQNKLGDKAVPMPDQTFMNMDFDTCVKTHDKHCNYPQNESANLSGDHRRQILFFCGQNRKRCLPFNSKIALQKAKRTVEQEYAVVGTWEDTNITLAVLEAYIPRFFRHAKVAYYIKQDVLSQVNKNTIKKSVSNEVKELLRKNFTREIEFYDFCKQRLYRQYAAISQQIGDNDDYILTPED